MNKTFEDGIIWACAELIRLHGQSTMAKEILEAAGITQKDLNCADYSDFQVIEKHIKTKIKCEKCGREIQIGNSHMCCSINLGESARYKEPKTKSKGVR